MSNLAPPQKKTTPPVASGRADARHKVRLRKKQALPSWSAPNAPAWAPVTKEQGKLEVSSPDNKQGRDAAAVATEVMQRTAEPGAAGDNDEIKPTASIDEGSISFGSALQAKLVVGSVDDPLEREADEVAERVLRMPDSALNASGDKSATLRRAPSEDEIAARKEAHESTSPTTSSPIAQLPVQTRRMKPVSLGTVPVSTPIAENIAALRRAGGAPLPHVIRSNFEERFGQSFSDVRVHTNEQSATVAKQIRAKAFTIGHDVVFGSGHFQPETEAGKRLLAHELTHVVQQRGQALETRNVAQRDEEDQQGTTEEPPVDHWAGTLVEAVLLSVNENRVAFRTAKGSIFGTVQKLDIAPGTYRLTPNLRNHTWEISGEGVRSGLRFHVTLEGALPWTLTYPNELPLVVQAGGSLEEQPPAAPPQLGPRIAGLKGLYLKYLEYRAENSLANTMRMSAPIQAVPGSLSAPHDLRARDLEVELKAGLAEAGIASIAEFEGLISEVEIAYRNETIHFAFAALLRYEEQLTAEEQRYCTGSAAQEIQSAVSSRAKDHYSEERSQRMAGIRAAPIPASPWAVGLPPLVPAQYEQAADAAHQRGEQAAIEAANGHPLVARQDFNRQRLAEAAPSEAQGVLLGYIHDRKKDIQTTRGELTNADIIWGKTLKKLRDRSSAALHIEPGSIQDLIIQHRVSQQADRELLTSLALGVLAAALAIASGGLGTGMVAFAAGVTSFSISATQAYESYREYERGSAAYHTDLSADDPSFAWVIVAVLGATADLAVVAGPALRTLRPLVTRFNQQRNIVDFEAAVARLSEGELPQAVRQRVIAAAREEAASRARMEQWFPRVAVGERFAVLGELRRDFGRFVYATYINLRRQVRDFQVFAKSEEALSLFGDLSKLTPDELTQLRSLYRQAVEDAQAIATRGISYQMDEAKIEAFMRMRSSKSLSDVLTEMDRTWLIPQTGKPSGVMTGMPIRGYARPHEIPYTQPPDMIIVRPGTPLRVETLDPTKRYLWVIDEAGDFRIAAEGQGTMFPKRAPLGEYHPQVGETPLKHGDLTPGPNGLTRGEARAGGELSAELGSDGRPTGRWIMNNDSSYTFARLDDIRLAKRHIVAAHQLLGTTGTDISKIVPKNTKGLP